MFFTDYLMNHQQPGRIHSTWVPQMLRYSLEQQIKSRQVSCQTGLCVYAVSRETAGSHATLIAVDTQAEKIEIQRVSCGNFWFQNSALQCVRSL